MNAVFNSYKGTKAGLDGRTFVKLLKEAGLIDAKFSTTSADLMFAKLSKAKLMDLANFKKAVAEHPNANAADMVLSKCGAGPNFQGTKIVQGGATQFNDKSTFTGAHTKGGPCTGALGVNQLADLAKREVTQNDALNRRKAGGC